MKHAYTSKGEKYLSVYDFGSKDVKIMKKLNKSING